MPHPRSDYDESGYNHYNHYNASLYEERRRNEARTVVRSRGTMSGRGGSHVGKYSASVSPGSPRRMRHEAVAAPVPNVAYYRHGEEVVYYYSRAASPLKKEHKMRLVMDTPDSEPRRRTVMDTPDSTHETRRRSAPEERRNTPVTDNLSHPKTEEKDDTAEIAAASALLLSAAGGMHHKKQEQRQEGQATPQANKHRNAVTTNRDDRDCFLSKMPPCHVSPSSSTGDNGSSSTIASMEDKKAQSEKHAPPPPSVVLLPHFPSLLHDVLSSSIHSGKVLEWLPHGQAWRVLRWDEMSNTVLPSYFPEFCAETSKEDADAAVDMFLWHVKAWGFEEVRKVGADMGSYRHKLFVRRDADLCRQMHLTGTPPTPPNPTRSSSPNTTPQTPKDTQSTLPPVQYRTTRFFMERNMLQVPKLPMDRTSSSSSSSSFQEEDARASSPRRTASPKHRVYMEHPDYHYYPREYDSPRRSISPRRSRLVSFHDGEDPRHARILRTAEAIGSSPHWRELSERELKSMKRPREHVEEKPCPLTPSPQEQFQEVHSPPPTDRGRDDEDENDRDVLSRRDRRRTSSPQLSPSSRSVGHSRRGGRVAHTRLEVESAPPTEKKKPSFSVSQRGKGRGPVRVTLPSASFHRGYYDAVTGTVKREGGEYDGGMAVAVAVSKKSKRARYV